MSFLYPQFLFALFDLAIPIIIHLFNFRRYKKIFFTNVRFLTDIQKESKSRNRLRNLLLLLLRLLALACIIIAFAQPYLPKKQNSARPGKNYVSIYVDNSFSMSNQSAAGDLLQVAKTKAEEIAKAYREGDAYQLVTNDFDLANQHWMNKAEFLTALANVNTSPSSREISEIYSREHENFRQADTRNKFAYWISDFQQNMADFKNVPVDSNLEISLIPLAAAKQNNLYIDSVWFDAEIWQLGQNDEIHARIINASDAAVEDGTMTLKINGAQKSLANFKIAPHSQITQDIKFTITEDGFNKAELSLTDYPITFDDVMYFSFPVSKDIPILTINADNPDKSIAKAFQAEKAFDYHEASQSNLDYSSFSKYKFIILNELPNISSGLATAVESFVEKGGNSLIIPPAQNIDAASYNQFTGMVNGDQYGPVNTIAVNLETIDLHNPFFHNMFDGSPGTMPQLKKYYKLQRTGHSDVTTLLKVNNGDPFFDAEQVKKGYLYIMAAPLESDWSNFSNHSLFLPVLYKMALFYNNTEKIYYTISKDNELQLQVQPENKDEAFKLKKKDFEVFPEQRTIDGNLTLFTEGHIKDAGQYELYMNKKENPADLLYVYSFNYDRSESEMKFLDADKLKDESARLHTRVLSPDVSSLTHEIKSLQEGSKFWKWFILAGILFLIAESIISRKSISRKS